MAQCITAVLGTKANTTFSPKNVLLNASYAEALGKSIVMDIGDGDMKTCSERLYDWCNETIGFNVYTATAALSPLTLQKTIDLGPHDYKLPLPGLPLPDKLCKILTGWMVFLQANIEVISKMAFALFDKIDKARIALEAFIKGAVDGVFECLENILLDIKERLSRIGVDADFGITGSASLDLEPLYPIMVDCPCICQAFAHMLNCHKDSEGNDISNNPDAVFACMQDKFSIGADINFGFDANLGDLICANLDGLYNMIMGAIDFAFELLMKPFRALIKAYADLLTKKFDVTAFLNTLGNLKCLFEYSVERKAGIDFYGMSIIDMINTLKGWTTCFRHLCPSITADIEAKIKEINENLRLNDSFWGGILEADLYDLCIAAKLGYKRMSEGELKKIYSNNPKNTFGNFKSRMDSCGLKEAVSSYKKRNKHRKHQRSALEEAITFRTAPDYEDGVNVGEMPIAKIDEKECVTIAKSLTSKATSPYFIEKFYQLLRMLGQYAMDDETVGSLQEILDDCSGKKFPTNMNKEHTSFSQNVSERLPLDEYPKDKEVTYFVNNDYNESEINRILGAYA